jgi:GDP-4-dehydro-6-deoxy-D-mannose reductase
LASLTHPPTSFEKPEHYFENNTSLMTNLCRLVRKTPIMYCSTCEVYGIVDGKITENVPMNPMNPYAVSKAAAELYFFERCRNGAANGFTVRPFSHTGPRRRNNYSIASDAYQLAMILEGKRRENVIYVGNLEARRNVVDVRDVCRCYYTLMMYYLNGRIENGDIFNICGNEVRSIGDYLNIMLSIYNRTNIELKRDEKLYRPIDILVQDPDSSKVRSQEIGWKPLIDISETLRDLVEYWRVKIKDV